MSNKVFTGDRYHLKYIQKLEVESRELHAIMALTKSISNDQELGAEIRKLVN